MIIYILYDTCYVVRDISELGATFLNMLKKPHHLRKGERVLNSSIFSCLLHFGKGEMIVMKNKSLKLSAVSLCTFALILSFLSTQPVHAEGTAAEKAPFAYSLAAT